MVSLSNCLECLCKGCGKTHVLPNCKTYFIFSRHLPSPSWMISRPFASLESLDKLTINEAMKQWIWSGKIVSWLAWQSWPPQPSTSPSLWLLTDSSPGPTCPLLHLSTSLCSFSFSYFFSWSCPLPAHLDPLHTDSPRTAGMSELGHHLLCDTFPEMATSVRPGRDVEPTNTYNSKN